MSKVSFDLEPQIVDVLNNSLIVLTLFSEEIRKVEEKKEYARQKFISRSGPDCRHGKNTYVINALSAFLYDTNNFLESHKEILNNLIHRKFFFSIDLKCTEEELHEETSDPCRI